MNRILKTSLASVFAVSMLAGGAFAASDPAKDAAGGTNDNGPSLQEKQKMVDEGTTGAVASGSMMMGSDMGAWKDGKITVVQVSSLNDTDPNKATLSDRMKSNPDEVAALQSAIQANPALKAQLESQNVQLNNVVAAEKATDGSVTFYVQ
jgi:hypothetical protein